MLSGINSPSQCTRQHEAYFQKNGRGISYTGYKITEKRLQFVNPTQTIFFKKKWGALHTEFSYSLSQILLRSIKSLSQGTTQHEDFFQKNEGGRGAFHVYPTQTNFFKTKWGGALHTEFTNSLTKDVLRRGAFHA